LFIRSIKSAHLWDVAEGRLYAMLSEHEAPVVEATFGAGGKRLLTRARDGEVMLWAVGSDRPLALLPTKASLTAFSPDGSRLATAQADGTVRLWPADYVGAVRRRLPRALTDAERRRYALPGKPVK
jgi:WD40 repeat protein